jgi:tRNA modification GTPase
VVSSETGAGLSALADAIDESLTGTAGGVIVDTPILTRARHIQGIHEARNEIAAFGQAWETETLPAPVAAVHLRSASVALETLIGAISTDDVLDRVFNSFCVGK